MSYLEFWNRIVTEDEEKLKNAILEYKKIAEEELEEFINFR
jgi:hypothetical protein